MAIMDPHGAARAIVAAVEDYWDGWFTGDAARMERALHPDFAKTGVGTDAAGRPSTESMTAPDMIGWTRAGEGVVAGLDSTRDITIDDAYYDIATVTVRSGVYREYLHVMRTTDGWKLLHALYSRVRTD
jgi:hypothetical protein